MVHVFREMGAEPHRPAASISLITDLFQLAQVGKCWESPEYAPAPQRMSIKKKRGDRSRCYRVKELSGLAFSTSPRLRSKKNRHPLRDGCLYSEVSVTKLIFCKGTKSFQSCYICRVLIWNIHHLTTSMNPSFGLIERFSGACRKTKETSPVELVSLCGR